jgi:hypothetical protein
MEKFVRKWLFARGFNVTRQTPTSEVMNLIKKLRPQECGKDLIRIGGDGDGGYLLPDDLGGIEYCFSPGVSTKSHFEEHLADLEIRSFLADYSVESPPVLRPEFTFDRMFLGASDHGHFFTLASWKNKYLRGYDGDLLLQMDIEGFEYEVILSTPDDLLNQFRIVVIEVHSLDKVFDKFAYQLISAFFDKLLKSFCIVHIHPNNCCGSVKRENIEIPRVMEFTFLNRGRVSEMKPAISFPHELDRDNVREIRALPLPKCWHCEV